MAELNRAVAALRIVGDDLIPDEITTMLGARPTRSFARGDNLSHKLTPTRVAKFGLWALDAPETEPADLDTQVSELLKQLTPDVGIWRELAEKFGVDLFCGWFMKFGNEGLAIAPGTLKALADRHMVLDLDIYAGDSELTEERLGGTYPQPRHEPRSGGLRGHVVAPSPGTMSSSA